MPLERVREVMNVDDDLLHTGRAKLFRT